MSTCCLLTSRRRGTRGLHLVAGSNCNAKAVPEATAEFTPKYSSDFGLIDAVLSLILTLVFQRYIVGGLTSGVMKG